MSSLDETSNKPVSGGLRSFVVLKDTQYATNRNEGGPWGETWKHRGLFPFSIGVGKSCDLVFLTDVMPIIGWNVAIGDNKGSNGWFPKTDFVRATNIVGINEDGTPVLSGTPCPFRAALGREPKLVFIAKIYENLGYEDKKTKTTIKDSVRYIMIDNQTILNVLCTHGQIDNGTAQYRRFKVVRSANPKSSRLGDSWIFHSFMNPEEINKKIPTAFERAAKIDLEKGFPIYTMAEAVSILKLHQKICDAHPNENRHELTYDSAGMAAVLSGGPLPKSPLESGKVSTVSAASGSLESMLDDDDTAGPNPFDIDAE